MAQTDIVATVIRVKLVILALALLLTHLTYRAYRRSGRPDIGTLSLGFAGMPVGILLGGGIYLVLELDILVALLFEAGFRALGLGMVAYPIYGFR